MTIGEALADARRQAGLTVPRCAERTRIRETIIRGIEADDFSPVRRRLLRARPHPQHRERGRGRSRPADRGVRRDHGRAARDSARPTCSSRSRRSSSGAAGRPNWTAAMVLALLVIVGVFACSSSSSHSSTPARNVAPACQPSRAEHRRPSRRLDELGRAGRPRTRPAQAAHLLTATQDCWVQLTGKTGATLFSGMVYAGQLDELDRQKRSSCAR